MLSERVLQFLDGATGFDANGEISPGVLDDLVEARGGKNDIGASGRIAPGKFCAASARDDDEVRVICETQDCGELLFIDGFENKPRLCAAN